MNPFWDQHAPFIRMLGPEHAMYVGLMVALAVAVITGRHRIRRHSATVRWAVAAVIIAQQVLLYGWYATETGFDLAESLPLHISRLSTLLGLAYFLTGRALFMDVLFYFGLFGYLSFAWPQRVYAPWHVIGVSFFINHAVTLLAPWYAVVVDGWRPTTRALVRAFAWFVAYLAVVSVVNPLVDGNYFYLKYRPVLASLPLSVYLPLAAAATLVLFALGHVAAQGLIGRTLDRPGPASPTTADAASAAAEPPA